MHQVEIFTFEHYFSNRNPIWGRRDGKLGKTFIGDFHQTGGMHESQKTVLQELYMLLTYLLSGCEKKRTEAIRKRRRNFFSSGTPDSYSGGGG